MAGQFKSKKGQTRRANEQAFDFLKSVEVDQVLQLALPNLVLVERPRQLKECEARLLEIEQELTDLYYRREDVLKVRQPQAHPITQTDLNVEGEL
jgi:hypothetical protein